MAYFRIRKHFGNYPDDYVKVICSLKEGVGYKQVSLNHIDREFLGGAKYMIMKNNIIQKS